MSTTTTDPVERLLDNVDQGHMIIKNPNVLRHDYIPKRILHRDKQQELITQSLIPLYRKSIPPNLLVYGKPGTGKTLVIKKVLNQSLSSGVFFGLSPSCLPKSTRTL